MKRSRKPQESERTAAAAPEPREEAPRITLRIEELESRLAPQSSTSILD